MNFRAIAARAAFTTTAVAAATMLFGAQAAVAATNDSFAVGTTSGGCGVVNFVDYGAGAPGGGNNDDYLVIHDYCGDGKGVRAYAWIGSTYLGAKNNTNGLAGSAVVWDPFGNVTGGQKVGIKVCLFDSNNTLSRCAEASRVSADG
ncbi:MULTISPECIES: hypothetical protein [unclassified Streptomyces]|uniref:hypothetical protein n=1 Tax=unclassified Streptomyces TaxID=2593676 RepID=UPI00093B01E3|nr:hypothetical protein [Streptomyces sp. CB02400]OKK10805.1 hypothetical protein AMK33_11680 [Streptomyces sp. CB02400]